jgi:hypothetical protein
LKDDCLAQLQHDVGLFKDLGVNTIYVCRSGIDWLGGLTLVYADSRRCDRPHQGPHACDEDIGRCGSSCPFCEFASIPGAKAAPRPADVVIRLTIPQTLVSIHHCIRRTDLLASYTLCDQPRLSHHRPPDRRLSLRGLCACHHGYRTRSEEIHGSEAPSCWPTHLISRASWREIQR